MKITKLKLNDIIEIDNRIFKIELRPQSNGFKKWLHPCLIVVRPEIKQQKLTKEQKEILLYQIKNIELNKKDLPIDENKIKKKNIFKKF